jgi:chromosome partitioning protein
MSAQPTGTESAEDSPPLLRDPCVIAIVAQKGGVAKTTTTVNLAAALASRGLRVCVIDLDAQGSASKHLGVYDPDPGELLDALERGDGLEAQEAAAGVDLVAGGTRLRELDRHAGDDSEVELERLIERSRLGGSFVYDVVLIDTPPHLGLATRSALAAADWIITPLQAQPGGMEGLVQTLEFLEAQRDFMAARHLGTVITFHDRRSSLSGEVIELVDGFARAARFGVTIPTNVAVARASGQGVPVVAQDARAAGARAYEQLADEVLGRLADG